MTGYVTATSLRTILMIGVGPALLLAALGLVVGAAVESVVAAYRRDRSFWP